MKTTLPKNVTTFTDRHGTTRYRFRKKGLPVRYINAQAGTPEFHAIYQECLIGAELIAAQSMRGTLPEHQVVYFVGFGDEWVKIGYATNLRQRLSQLQTSSARPLILLAWQHGGPVLEKMLHDRFRKLRGRGEWFKRTGELAELLAEWANHPGFAKRQQSPNN